MPLGPLHLDNPSWLHFTINGWLCNLNRPSSTSDECLICLSVAKLTLKQREHEHGNHFCVEQFKYLSCPPWYHFHFQEKKILKISHKQVTVATKHNDLSGSIITRKIFMIALVHNFLTANHHSPLISLLWFLSVTIENLLIFVIYMIDGPTIMGSRTQGSLFCTGGRYFDANTLSQIH